MSAETVLTSLVALLFMATVLLADESRTYIVNTDSTSLAFISVRGTKRDNQPLNNTKSTPIPRSPRCVKVEISPSDQDKLYLSVLESNGSAILISKSLVYNYPDPATGDLLIGRIDTSISKIAIPPECFDVAIASKGVKIQ